MSVQRKPAPNPRFRRGDVVQVREDGIRPWSGEVKAVKWSHVSGWWCDVEREDSLVWIVHEDKVRAVQPA